MSAPPYMQLYIADYLADTTHLTTVEHGAYLLLLMALWRAGGKLPRDAEKLARIARLTPDEWAAVEGPVLEFFTMRGGSITQKRATRELERYRATVEGRKSAGKASAAKKANKSNEQAPTNVEPLLQQKSTNQNHNQNKIIELETLRVSNPINRAGAFERFWSAYPSKVGKRAAEAAFAKAIKRTDPETIIGAVQAAQGCDQWRRGFIPNPTTWLNQDRWTDEHAPPPVSDKLVRRHENYRRAFAGASAAFDAPDFDG